MKLSKKEQKIYKNLSILICVLLLHRNIVVEYSKILYNIIEKLIEYNIDIKESDFYKKNLPSDLEECVVALKKNLIARESKAWDIARTIVVFNSNEDRYLFERIREYALATYNFGNLKSIIREHNII